MKDEFIKEEEQRMKRPRLIVNLMEAVLMQSNLTLQESVGLVGKHKEGSLFPGKESLYDLSFMLQGSEG